MNIKEYFSIHPSERYQNYLEHISKASHKSGTYISDGMLHFDGHDDRIDAAEQRLWKLKREVK